MSSLVNHFEYVIAIDEDNLPKLCKAKFKAECPYQIIDETCEYISYKAKHSVQTSVNYLKRVLEYLEFKKIETVITRDLVEEIFDIAGVGTTFEEDDEVINVLKEIRNSLRDIQDDVHALHGSIEDFIAANGGDWQ